MVLLLSPDFEVVLREMRTSFSVIWPSQLDADAGNVPDLLNEGYNFHITLNSLALWRRSDLLKVSNVNKQKQKMIFDMSLFGSSCDVLHLRKGPKLTQMRDTLNLIPRIAALICRLFCCWYFSALKFDRSLSTGYKSFVGAYIPLICRRDRAKSLYIFKLKNTYDNLLGSHLGILLLMPRYSTSYAWYSVRFTAITLFWLCDILCPTKTTYTASPFCWWQNSSAIPRNAPPVRFSTWSFPRTKRMTVSFQTPLPAG